MKKHLNPKIEINTFNCESILTTLSVSPNALDKWQQENPGAEVYTKDLGQMELMDFKF